MEEHVCMGCKWFSGLYLEIIFVKKKMHVRTIVYHYYGHGMHVCVRQDDDEVMQGWGHFEEEAWK